MKNGICFLLAGLILYVTPNSTIHTIGVIFVSISFILFALAITAKVNRYTNRNNQ